MVFEMRTRRVRALWFLFGAVALCAGGIDAQEYRIGKGDVIELVVWNEPSLNCKVEVRANGAVEFPLIGLVEAEGLTVTELERRVEEALENGYLKSAQVKVSVAEYRSKQVYVLGAVSMPGTYMLRKRMTLLELLAQTGGLFGEGGDNIIIVRVGAEESEPKPTAHDEGPKAGVQEEQPQMGTPEEGPKAGEGEGTAAEGQEPEQAQGPTVITISKWDLLSGKLSANVVLEDRDIVLFPPRQQVARRKVFVLGDIKTPGPFPLEDDMSLARLIAAVGGPASSPKSEVTITRTSLDGAESKTFNVRNVILGKEGADFRLKDGDILLFSRPTELYYVVGEVNEAGAFHYREGLTVEEAIIFAGWKTARGNLNKIKVRRKVEGKWQEIPVQLSDLVLPGDVIRVPERWF